MVVVVWVDQGQVVAIRMLVEDDRGNNSSSSSSRKHTVAVFTYVFIQDATAVTSNQSMSKKTHHRHHFKNGGDICNGVKNISGQSMVVI